MEGSRFAEAVRFWEPARLAFNVVLALIVIVPAFLHIDGSQAQIQHYGAVLPVVIFLAVMANVVYCAAYPFDLLVQAMAPRAHLPYWRWSVLALGMLISIAIALLITTIYFSSAMGQF